MGARSVIIEDALGRADVEDEIAHLEEWAVPADGAVTAATITFLTSGFRPKRDYSAVRTEAVIGQVTIVTYPTTEGRVSYAFEAIIRLPCKGASNEQLLNNHVPISDRMPLSFGGVTHRVPAAYFCQQNGITSICAHSAVRTLVRTLTDKTICVRSLNDLWGYDPDVRSVTTIQVENALKAFGLRPIGYNLGSDPMAEGDRGWGLFALLADSASPSLLVISGGAAADHVMPVIGHTFNSDEWHPLGTTLHVDGKESISSSSLWTDHLVMHDDVLGPYFCLSRSALFSGGSAELSPQRAIAILPEGVEVSPLQAEDFARQILPSILRSLAKTNLGRGPWWRHLLDSRERRVFRTTLIDKKTYLATLPSSPGKTALAAVLPERIWMAEISLPNLFLANRAKLGELLISTDTLPTEEGAELETLLGFRLPSVLGWSTSAGADNRRSFAATSWPETGHRAVHAPGHHANQW